MSASKTPLIPVELSMLSKIPNLDTPMSIQGASHGEGIFWDFIAFNGALGAFVSIPANGSAPKSLRLRFGNGRSMERLVSDKSKGKSDNILGDLWDMPKHIDQWRELPKPFIQCWDTNTSML
ncbi:uncharacterized protein B0H18DRAFT_959263 [Fomitopsis serialis]|uniref:uncharacterized protein n=1 Tax=Fomitopsis serialis TaxID=139415 RepID=UPI0020087BB5|nr:uncharacterized protein B0H18DRAFT_959263 [Neoantrodia serialis]KAH9915613.1 hypothetical protein B0H18DRAFT_959263 [Neoantrodia serialis]